ALYQNNTTAGIGRGCTAASTCSQVQSSARDSAPIMESPVQPTSGDAVPDATPLCVDLDGTLIRTDLLLESAVSLLKQNPLYLFAYPLWLLRGRANLKHEIATRVHLDATTLPYDGRLLDALRTEHTHRPVILCTASNQVFAKRVAQHLGTFSAVMATDGTRNLSGSTKAAALVDRFGESGFDYAGNEGRDIAIWRHARNAWVVNGSADLADRADKVCRVAMVLPREGGGLRTWLHAFRLHQWLKNVLVFVPLLAAHLLMDPVALVRATAAFLVFGVCASSVYILNDILDLDADRLHTRKRKRPFASGSLPLAAGFVVAPLMTLAAFVAANALEPRFALVLLGYYALTLAYSFRFKQIAMLDVLVLAALY